MKEYTSVTLAKRILEVLDTSAASNMEKIAALNVAVVLFGQEPDEESKPENVEQVANPSAKGKP